jgi:potassium-transporting ATPase KdpC subunit
MQHVLFGPALRLYLVLTLLTGILYPLVITGAAHVLFPQQAAGSLLLRRGEAVGSRLVGQSFSSPGYFWSRPSATAPQPYNALASGGSNLGPLNPALLDAVRERIATARAGGIGPASVTAAVPADLVTSSASGLDPDISLAAADYQVARIAAARRLPLQAVQSLLAAHAQGRLFGILGEPRVNVLELNLALDDMDARLHRAGGSVRDDRGSS